MQKIRKKYGREFLSLRILEIDQYPELEGEKAYIEELVRAASSSKQKDWIRRLLNEDDETHIGAWFEVMLYGWLKEIGAVEIEPEIETNRPDFSLDVHGIRIIIEATTRLISGEERIKRKYKKKAWKVLAKIKQPYCIFIRKAEFNSTLNRENLKTDVENWLVTDPDNPFRFRDENGNILHLDAKKEESLCAVAIGGDPNYCRIDSEQLKKH